MKLITYLNRDEDRDKSCDHLKSSSSEESVRKRRPSANISLNSQLSIFSQASISTEADVNPLPQQKHHSRKFILNFAPNFWRAGKFWDVKFSLLEQDHQTTPTHPTQSKPIKIINNELPKSNSSSTSAGSSSDSTERLILTRETIASTTSNQNAKTVSGSTTNSTGSAGAAGENDFHYESIVDNQNANKPKYTYHDEPHSFENSMEFLEDYKNFQYEVLETTV